MADIEYCEWMTGFPIKFYDFIASCETDGSAVEFYSSAPLEIDWGSGKYLKYEAGNIHGYQLNTNSNDPIILRGAEPVVEFRFGSGIDYDRGFKECHIHKAFDLENASKLCYRLEEMHTFSFFGTNKVKDFSSAWEDCTELTKFDGMDTTEAESFFRSWKNCNKLVAFPSIYSRVSNTVEEAWMGCTSMKQFPIIGSEKCINFKSAWRGNIQLVDFPLIDVSSGQNFDHAWAYCINLVDFPTLDYRSAENMDYAFAYNYKIKSLPTFNTGLSSSFNSTFEKNINLTCIQGLDTNGATRDNMVDIFKECCMLMAPHDGILPDGSSATSEQERLRDGWKYTNQGECYFDAGRSVFYAVATTNDNEDDVCSLLNICTIDIEGGDVEIDWGDGIFIPHNGGTITGLPIDTGVIHIRSEEAISKVTFVSDTFYTVSIKRGKTLTTCEGMCAGLTLLRSFSIYGNMYATNYSHILDGCTSLVDVNDVDWSYAGTIKAAFRNCTSLISFSTQELIDLTKCIDFTSAWENCSSLTRLNLLNTPLGELFAYMVKDCVSLACMTGVNTTNQTSTIDMFLNTPILTRPNVNEQPRILTGANYNNGGSCTAAFSMIFTATHNGTTYNEISFTTDYEVDIDWGDGVYVKAGPGIITGTPTGVSYVFGPVEALSFDTPLTFEEIAIISGDLLTDMSNICENMTNLNNFRFMGTNQVTTWHSAFKNCTSLQYFFCNEYPEATIFTSMFQGDVALTNVGDMNTLVGEEFEYMFSSCTSLNLTEINTMNGNFAKYFIACDTSIFDCATGVLPCTPGSDLYSCTVYYNCDPVTGDVFPCFGTSTMFENWLPAQIPIEAHRIAIQSKAHWKNGEIL